MFTYVKSGYAFYLRISNIVIASILLIACAAESLEIVNITDTGVTESQIVQTKVFDQCESASVLKAEVQFSKSNEQASSKELVINGGIEGEVAIPFTAKAQLEGGLETHLKSLNSETTGHQESAMIEVPAHAQQEYAITWREIYRQGEISYVEDGQTKVATFSARIGVELVKTTVRDLGCPEKVASNQLSTPIPAYTPLPATSTPTRTPFPATKTPTRKPPTATLTRTKIPVPPTRTPAATPTVSANRILLSDTFDNRNYAHGYNTNVWQCDGCETARISNNDDSIRFEIDGIGGFGIHTRSTWSAEQIGFVEAKLKISEYEGADNGDVQVAIATTISSGWWLTFCYIEGKRLEPTYGFLTCSVVKAGPSNAELYACFSKSVRVTFDEWHTAKIELNAANFTLRFYVDGEQVGSCTPEDSEELKKQRFRVQLGSTSNGNNRHMVTGADDLIVAKP